MRALTVTIVFLLAAALAGCVGRSNVNAGFAGSRVSAPSAGTTSTGGSVGVQVQGGSAAGAALGIAVMGAAIYASERSGPDGEGALAPGAAAPPLDATRKVREVDCTQPIEDYSANIKCK
jgi:hypothetical protein